MSDSAYKGNVSYALAKPYICDIARLVGAFIAEYGEPGGFSCSSPGWLKAEAEIEDAIAQNDVRLTRELCAAHRLRVVQYLRGWIGKLEQGAIAS